MAGFGERMAPLTRLAVFPSTVAGHTNCGTHLIDTHDSHVIDPVWSLYRLAHELTGGAATLLEWDANIPDFEVVHREVLKAHAYVLHGSADPPPADRPAAGDVEPSFVPHPATLVAAEVE